MSNSFQFTSDNKLALIKLMADEWAHLSSKYEVKTQEANLRIKLICRLATENHQTLQANHLPDYQSYIDDLEKST